MCGIVGYIGQRDAAPLILESLRKLEYRGYDSAGIAVLHDSRVTVSRAEGKLDNLATMLERHPMTGTIGIGHTRWATHGRPSENNAHPHRAGDIVVVHNGIIENYLELKRQLIKRGTHFSSETDSEIVAHLVAEKVARGVDFLDAVQRTLREIHGSYALLFLNRRDPTRMIVAKNSTPIVIGGGDGETFIASDIPALLDYTRKVTFLEDGEIGEVTVAGFRLLDGKGKQFKRPVKQITWDAIAAQKGGYPHFMLKEIHDQPRALADTFRGRIALKDGNVALEDIKLNASAVKQIKRIHLVACGTAWHACLVGKFLLEEIAGIPAEVDYGSEFRYRSPLMDPKSILLMVSQSGETADTLAAIDIARAKRAKILSICNVIDSSIPRKSHGVLYTHAGPEISVASTKAFTTQLTALYLLAVALGRMNGKLKSADARKLLRDLMHLPSWIEEALKLEAEVKDTGARAAPQPRFSLSRPRHQLSDRAGGRAQAQRDFLHPRRRLSRRRDEAWADRLDRRETAGSRAGAARPLFRENHQQSKRSRIARRQSHRPHRRRQNRRGNPGISGLDAAQSVALSYAHRDDHSAAIARLSHRRARRYRCRSAAQSGQERHGRIMALWQRGSTQLAITLSSLKHRNFRLLFFGTSLSHVGDFIQAMAQSWLVWTDDQVAVPARRRWLRPGAAAIASRRHRRRHRRPCRTAPAAAVARNS